MKTIIEDLNWRYATKKFDPKKKVASPLLNTLLEAARLSASSYGLQPYHIFVIEDIGLRRELRKFSWDQSQISDASHLLLFAIKEGFGEELVDSYVSNVVKTRDISQDSIEGYSDFMKEQLLVLPKEDKNSWTSRQVYLALGNVMTVAATLKVDTCPIEGFENEKYNEILGLNDKNLSAVVVLAIGYRSHTDETQHWTKVRYPKEELITHL